MGLCTIQPNTQVTNLAGGYEPPLQWLGKYLGRYHSTEHSGSLPGGRLVAAPTSVLIPKLYVFVGRGHDPADQVAHFALARFNESAFISLRFGGVMTPPYEWRVR